MALSDDGEDDELLQELQGVRDGPDKRRKRGESKKSVGRRSGGKRSKAFEAPLPLEYKKTDDGRFQKYKWTDTHLERIPVAVSHLASTESMRAMRACSSAHGVVRTSCSPGL